MSHEWHDVLVKAVVLWVMSLRLISIKCWVNIESSSIFPLRATCARLTGVRVSV